MKKKITLRDLDAPSVVLANTYYWRPGSSSSNRRYNERKRRQEVKDWLEHLIIKYNLDLDVVEDGGIRVFDKDGNEVAYFSYSESARHVYKHQNFTDLLSMITKKIKEDQSINQNQDDQPTITP